MSDQFYHTYKVISSDKSDDSDNLSFLYLNQCTIYCEKLKFNLHD